MVDRLDGQLGSMVNRSDYERLRGFGEGLTDTLTDRRTFAILKLLLRLKRTLFCAVILL